MSKLVIRRRSQWLNKMRGIGLYLNGREIGRLKDGETREFEVPPGEHILMAKIDWCSSRRKIIQIEKDQVQKLEVGGFRSSKWLVPTAVVMGLVVLVLQLLDIFYHPASILIFIPFFLYLLYFLTFGRQRYLRLMLVSEKGRGDDRP